MENLLKAVATEKSCANCGTFSTPQWRGDLCNACAMFYRRHRKHKPIDPISLETYDMRYDVITENGSHHDARQLALHILNGGNLHPLTRQRFTAGEVRDIYERVRFSEVGPEFARIARNIANRNICDTLGRLRAARFLNILAGEVKHWGLNARVYLELLVHSEFSECPSLTTSEHVRDAMARTRFSEDELEVIRAVIVSPDLDEKCEFVRNLPVPSINIDPKVAAFLSEFFALRNIKTSFLI